MALGLLQLIGLATLAILGISQGPQPAFGLDAHHGHHSHAARAHAHNVHSYELARREVFKRDFVSRHGTLNRRAPQCQHKTGGGDPTPAPTPAPVPARKTGICWSGSIDIGKWGRNSPKLSAAYNWSVWKDNRYFDQLPGVEFLTMFWGKDKLSEWQDHVINNRNSAYSKFALGFNEPDQQYQSNMNPWDAAWWWRTYIQPLKSQGYTLISPATTNAPDGVEWLRNFFWNACSDCTIDGVATHFYGTDSEALIGHIQLLHNSFGRNVWLTEFACQDFSWRQQCSMDQIWAFMKRTTEYMDSQSWVALYAWFGAFTDNAIADVNHDNRIANWDSTPNELGKRYLGLEPWGW